MLAAGVKAPVPLDELESHLRDEIEQQRSAGLSETEAYETAVLKIGEGGSLKAEFAKTSGILAWFGDDQGTRINHVLGVLWFAQCLWFLTTMAMGLFKNFALPTAFTFEELFIMLYLGMLIAGIQGSIRVFRGMASGRRTIMTLAVMGLVLAIVQVLRFRSFSFLAWIITVFYLASIWLLRPQKRELATR